MPVKIFRNFAQYSPEFWEHRRGKPSTSEFHRIITARTRKLSAAADGYIAQLCAEQVHFDPNFFTEKPRSAEMEHGSRAEAEARKWYALEANTDIEEVGGVFDGRFWSSPDGLIGDDGILECKCPQLETHVKYLLDRERLLNEYQCQVHGQLIVSGRKWVDLVSYVVGLAPIIIRVVPDDFTRELRITLEQFWERFQAVLKQIAPYAQ